MCRSLVARGSGLVEARGARDSQVGVTAACASPALGALYRALAESIT